MYSVSAYGRMITDAARTAAYIAALRRTIKSGSVVIDLGCGPGLFAILACKFGARRVYAIEPDNVIQLAREAAANNGVSDRIEFLQDFSTNICLPEQADVIVSDLRGILPFFQKHLPSIKDARTRLLKQDGILIPGRDNLWAAIADSPDVYGKLIAPWESSCEGVSLAAARKVVTNTWTKVHIRADSLLVDPICWHTIDYYNIEGSRVETDLRFTTTRNGTAHALVLWFDSQLHDGIEFSNAPGQPELIYGQAFFPFERPVELNTGDEVHLYLRASLINEDYVWRWETKIYDGHSSQTPKAEFKQSTLCGAPLSPSQLRKRSATYVPSQTDAARLVSFVLGKMNGHASLEQIAFEVAKRFPSRFHTADAAFNFVAELSYEYSN